MIIAVAVIAVAVAVAVAVIAVEVVRILLTADELVDRRTRANAPQKTKSNKVRLCKPSCNKSIQACNSNSIKTHSCHMAYPTFCLAQDLYGRESM